MANADYAETTQHPVGIRPAHIAAGLLIWAVTAAAVTLIDRDLNIFPVIDTVIVKAVAVLFAGYAYTRLFVRNCTVDQAVLAGLSWVLLSIGAEIAVTATTHRSWFALVGSAVHPSPSDLLFLAWLTAPAMFARCT